ncbi:MAG: hypothetical protein AAGC92_14275 [Pseudomonadota bacterium]
MSRVEIPAGEIRGVIEKIRHDLRERLEAPRLDHADTQFLRGQIAILRELEMELGLSPQALIPEAARKAAGGVRY